MYLEKEMAIMRGNLLHLVTVRGDKRFESTLEDFIGLCVRAPHHTKCAYCRGDKPRPEPKLTCGLMAWVLCPCPVDIKGYFNLFWRFG